VDPILPILLAITLFVLTAGAISALLYLDRLSKDVRLVQQLLVAYMKKTVASTVADRELAQVVREATKTAVTPAGVAR